jgi:hypothetical protein
MKNLERHYRSPLTNHCLHHSLSLLRRIRQTRRINQSRSCRFRSRCLRFGQRRPQPPTLFRSRSLDCAKTRCPGFIRARLSLGSGILC